MPPEIFASYSREDQAQVFPIVDKLRERGLNIWINLEVKKLQSFIRIIPLVCALFFGMNVLAQTKTASLKAYSTSFQVSPITADLGDLGLSIDYFTTYDGNSSIFSLIEGEKEITDLLRKHGGKTAEELRAEGK